MLLDLVKAGKISRKRFVEAMTVKPASIFRLNGGTLKKGSVADISILNPNHEWTFNKETCVSLSKNSPWIGTSMTGHVETLLVGGKVIVKDKKIYG